MAVSLMPHADSFALVKNIPQTLAPQFTQDGLQPIPIKHSLAQLLV